MNDKIKLVVRSVLGTDMDENGFVEPPEGLPAVDTANLTDRVNLPPEL